MVIVPEAGTSQEQRQEDLEFQASLGYIVRTYLPKDSSPRKLGHIQSFLQGKQMSSKFSVVFEKRKKSLGKDLFAYLFVGLFLWYRGSNRGFVRAR
jgi:hypothetical protein